MHVHTRNVNTAFRELVALFNTNGRCIRVVPSTGDECREVVPIVRRPSRNGDVLVIDEPVTVSYSHPRERVLFNAARDANPFLHLYEALWMLAGRNDVAPLAYYAKQMASYSDDGVTLNGAYGYRWRHAKQYIPTVGPGGVRNDVDQLDGIVNHLKADPTSRRAVLQMWNVEDDLLKIGRKLGETCNNATVHDWGFSKDVCCNLSVMFSLREVHFGSRSDMRKGMQPPHDVSYLDMTVTNRSNDLMWGMLGANYTTFTLLQEYVAARLGAEVGRYHHFTNNLHAHVGDSGMVKWEPEKWLAADQYDGSERERNEPYSEAFPGFRNIVPLVRDHEAFERELPRFVEAYSGDDDKWLKLAGPSPADTFTEPFLKTVAEPMLLAFRSYKRRHWDQDLAVALGTCLAISADDWRLAATAWLQRRVE